MKLSISLPDADVVALDAYVAAHELGSRSAGLQRAIRSLSDDSLVDDYAAAFTDWQQSSDAPRWDATSADGLGDATR